MVASARTHAPHVLGWNVLVDIPEWHIGRLRAKVDTGARTSALHVDKIVPLGGQRVRFDVVLHRRNADKRVRVETTYHRTSRVRSSNGHYETRYIVMAKVHVGPIVKEIEIGLAARSEMRFRMLLGRGALAGDFLIDVRRRGVSAPNSEAFISTHARTRKSP